MRERSERQRGDSTDESCPQTRKHIAADRPQDAKRRRDTQILVPVEFLTSADEPRQSSPRREVDPDIDL